jgi:hypothetical protein
VCIQKDNEWKIMFQTCNGHFEYVMIPLALQMILQICNTWWIMSFCEYLNDFMVYCINKILIFFKNMEDHKWHVHLFWRSLGKSNFTPNWRDVNFIKLKSIFFCHIIFKDGIRIDPPYCSNHCGLGYSIFFWWCSMLYIDLPIFTNRISLHIISQ